MKLYASILKTLFVTLPSLGLVLSATNAWAGSQIYDPQDTCTTENCGATLLYGQPLRNNFGQSQPFTLQVYGSRNQCMRLHVIEQFDDMEIVLVSPSGKVWRDDDGGGSNRPLVKAITDVDGWYTLQINRYDGEGANSASGFRLAYGIYNSDNPNCQNPTQSAAGTRGATK